MPLLARADAAPIAAGNLFEASPGTALDGGYRQPLAMPRALARAAGMPNRPLLTRAYGLREIGVGVGLLTSKDPTPWLWGRVAGDALDVATVGAGLVTAGKPLRTLVSLATLCSIAYVDFKTDEAPRPPRAGKNIRASTTACAPASPNRRRRCGVRPASLSSAPPERLILRRGNGRVAEGNAACQR